jgi:SOS response regulatory protein OraA/RecX
MLGRKGYSIYGMRNTLIGKDYSETEVAQVIAQLEEWGYLNDEMFAQNRIDHLRQVGKGREYVLNWLINQGIAQHDAQTYVDDNYSLHDEVLIAKKLLEKSYITGAMGEKEHSRFYRRLTAAGFTVEALNACGYGDGDT